MKLRLLLSCCLLLAAALFSSTAAAAPALRLIVQEGTSSSGEADYSTKKYQPLANQLSAYLKREVQVVGLSPLRQFDPEPMRQGDIFLVRPNSVAGMAIQSLGFVPVVGLESGTKTQVLMMGSANLKRALKSPEELKKLRFAMPPADSETAHDAMRMLEQMGVRPDQMTVYNVKLQATIPFALENKLADVGVVKSDATVTPKMGTAGYIVLAESEKKAPWVVLASKKVPDEVRDQLRVAMQAMMNNPEQKSTLQSLRIQSVQDVNAQMYLDAYKRYLGK